MEACHWGEGEGTGLFIGRKENDQPIAVALHSDPSPLCGNDTRSCWLMMQYHFQPSVGSFVIVSILGSVAMPKWSLRLKTLALSNYKRYFKQDHNSHFPPYWTCVVSKWVKFVFLMSSLCSIKDSKLVIAILSTGRCTIKTMLAEPWPRQN